MKKTVKKVLALFMALTLSVSLLSVIPVSAEAVKGYPISFYDMEDMDINNFSIEEGGSITAVAGGAGGSVGSLKVVNGNYATDAGQPKVSPTLAFKGSYGDIAKDGTMRVSFWLKLEKPLANNKLLVLASDKTTSTWTTFTSRNAVIFDKDSTEWQKVVMEAPVSAGASYGQISLRFGDFATGYNATVDAEEGFTGERVYYIDDVEFAVYSKGVIRPAVNKNPMTLDNYFIDFEENGTSGYLYIYGKNPVTTTKSEGDWQSIQIVDDPTGASGNRVMKYDLGDKGSANTGLIIGKLPSGQGSSSVTIAPGEKLICKMKLYLTEELTNGHVYIPNPNIRIPFNGKKVNQWQEITVVKENTGTENISSGWTEFRFGIDATEGKAVNLEEGETYGSRTIYLDDIDFYIESPANVYPKVENITTSIKKLPEKAFVFDYDFTAGDAGTDASYVKLMATDPVTNVKAAIASGYASEGVIIPASAYGKELSFEFIPMDSEGYVGVPVAFDMPEDVVLPDPTAGPKGYPLSFYNMEKVNINDFSIEEGGSIAAADNGAGGSNGSLKVVNNNNATDAGQPMVSPTLAFKGSYGEIIKGGIMRVSFWLKLEKELANNKLIVIAYDKTTKTYVNFASRNSVAFDKNSTEWQKVVMEAQVSAGTSFGQLSIRFGDFGSGYNATQDAESGFTGERVYYIDDVEIAVYSTGAIRPAVTKNPMTLNNYFVDFEADGTSGYLYIYGKNPVTTTKSEGDWQSIQIVDDPAGVSGNRVMKYDLGDKDSNLTGLILGKAPSSQGSTSVTIAPGEKLVSKMKLYLTEELTNGYVYIPGLEVRVPFDGSVVNQWQEITVVKANTGEEAIAKTWLEFRFGINGEKQGIAVNLEEGETYGSRTIYFDDIEFYVENPANVYPKVENITASGKMIAGETVTFNYNFTAGTTGEDISYVKLMATDPVTNASAAIAGAYVSDGIVIPASATGKELSFEIIPMDSEGYVGAPVAVAAPVYEPFTFTISDDAENTTAYATVAFSADYEGIDNVYLIMAQYTTDNKLVRAEMFDTVSDLKINGSLDYSAEDNTTLIKAFLWTKDGKLLPLADAETIEK